MTAKLYVITAPKVTDTHLLTSDFYFRASSPFDASLDVLSARIGCLMLDADGCWDLCTGDGDGAYETVFILGDENNDEELQDKLKRVLTEPRDLLVLLQDCALDRLKAACNVVGISVELHQCPDELSTS